MGSMRNYGMFVLVPMIKSWLSSFFICQRIIYNYRSAVEKGQCGIYLSLELFSRQELHVSVNDPHLHAVATIDKKYSIWCSCTLPIISMCAQAKFWRIHYAYKLLWCLDDEIWLFCGDDRWDKTNFFTPCTTIERCKYYTTCTWLSKIMTDLSRSVDCCSSEWCKFCSLKADTQYWHNSLSSLPGPLSVLLLMWEKVVALYCVTKVTLMIRSW